MGRHVLSWLKSNPRKSKASADRTPRLDLNAPTKHRKPEEDSPTEHQESDSEEPEVHLHETSHDSADRHGAKEGEEHVAKDSSSGCVDVHHQEYRLVASRCPSLKGES
jgi:hypothetical protein